MTRTTSGNLNVVLVAIFATTESQRKARSVSLVKAIPAFFCSLVYMLYYGNGSNGTLLATTHNVRNGSKISGGR
jgi:hypothetical protein